MSCLEHPGQGSEWRRAVCRIYQMSLRLYPQGFRRQFGPEMNAVFAEALDERAGQGRAPLLLFLGREAIEAPFSAVNQRLAHQAGRIMACLNIVWVYGISFFLLGLIDLWGDEAGAWAGAALARMILGGLGGLSVGMIVAPHRKTMFALCGMVCVPIVLAFPMIWVNFYWLGLALVILNWRRLLRVTGYGMLACLVGLLANRVSAALLQSCLYHSPTQALAQTGPAMVLLPLFASGISLGILFAGISFGQSAAPT